jgi:hypothetical protein
MEKNNAPHATVPLGQEAEEVFSLFPSDRSSKKRISRSPSSKALNGEKPCTSHATVPLGQESQEVFILCFP